MSEWRGRKKLRVTDWWENANEMEKGRRGGGEGGEGGGGGEGGEVVELTVRCLMYWLQ